MTSKIYLHDRLLAASLLRLIPKRVTPNQVTLLRMALTPAVLWFLFQQRYAVAIPLFLFTALTDMLDGSLARTRGQVTRWGIMWDPVADKLLIGSVAVLLMARHFPVPLAAVILGLEAAFLAGGWYRKLHGEVVAANWWGKIKMLLQVIGVFLFLLSLAFGSGLLAAVSYAVFALACVLAVISLFRHGL